MICNKTISLVAAALVAGAAAQAAPVNGTGNVTPDVFFGSGNANGSFTGVTVGGLELALRGKLRYDGSGLPQNTFNYDGDHTYTFDPSLSNAPADHSIFNFEWSINTDTTGSVGRNLDAFTYLLSIDYDPTPGRATTVDFDPIFTPLAVPPGYADHAFGNNTTNARGLGSDVEIATTPSEYRSNISQFNVAQNSWNLGFFEPPGFDPQTEGLYTINLSAFDRANTEVAFTSIDVVVGTVPAVPLPASALLLGTALAGLGFLRRRRG